LESCFFFAWVNLLMVDWHLGDCCGNEEVIFITLCCAFPIVTNFFWHYSFLWPFKLLTVFLHELGHASACWGTCGKVISMDVNAQQGGYTYTQGGSNCLILPAGYLGSSFWGAFFLILSTGDLTAQVAAGFLICSMLVVATCYADTCYLRCLCLFFIALTGSVWAIQIYTPINALRWLIMFIGSMNGFYSVFDIYDDLIRPRPDAHKSDGAVFAQRYGCTRCFWGFVWGIFAIAIYVASIYFGILILVEDVDTR